MPFQKAEIVAMQVDDIPICASFFSRRPLYYPRRLVDPSIPKEQRNLQVLQGLEADLYSSGLLLYVAKIEGEAVGWTRWVVPEHLVQNIPNPNIPNTDTPRKYVSNDEAKDPERDDEIMLAVRKQWKVNEKRFFGNHSNW